MASWVPLRVRHSSSSSSAGLPLYCRYTPPDNTGSIADNRHYTGTATAVPVCIYMNTTPDGKIEYVWTVYENQTELILYHRPKWSGILVMPMVMLVVKCSAHGLDGAFLNFCFLLLNDEYRTDRLPIQSDRYDFRQRRVYMYSVRGMPGGWGEFRWDISKFDTCIKLSIRYFNAIHYELPCVFRRESTKEDWAEAFSRYTYIQGTNRTGEGG